MKFAKQVYTSVNYTAFDGTDYNCSYRSTIVAKKVSIIIIINTEVMYIRICMHGIQVRCARMCMHRGVIYVNIPHSDQGSKDINL